MQIVNKDGATIVAPPSTAAKERAIAAFMQPNTPAQQSPVSNPTNVAPEEMGAIRQHDSEDRRTINNESPVSESSKAETKVTDEQISSQYAVLARKEKQLRLRDQQLRKQEAAIKVQEEARLEALKPKAPTLDESKYISKEKLTQDPFSVLAELGLTYDQLTQLAINAPKPEEIALNNKIKYLEDQIKGLKGEQETTKKSFEEQQQTSYKQALNQITNDVTQLVNSDPNLEMVKATRSVRDVVELIEKTFNEDGVLMSVEDAASEVENYLVEEAMRLAKSKKIQQRLQPKAASTTQQATKTTDPKQSQLKTLTNSVSSSRKLTSRERAMLAFEGKLNK